MKVSSEIIDMSPGNKKPEKDYFFAVLENRENTALA